MAVAYHAAENALLGDEITLVLHHERARLAQLDGVTDFCIALIPYRQRVDGLFEGLYQRLGGGSSDEILAPGRFYKAVFRGLDFKRRISWSQRVHG